LSSAVCIRLSVVSHAIRYFLFPVHYLLFPTGTAYLFRKRRPATDGRSNSLDSLPMSCDPFEVKVIGAGTGGLCLAQGLKAEGIPVEVFERERTPFDRQAGYRLSISPTGNRALKECLPESLFQKLVQNSARPSRGVSFLDERLRPLLTIRLPEADAGSVDCERPISQIALRPGSASGTR
jgi:hypothetical protein